MNADELKRLKELIARLEAATEGSRKLDEMIGHAVRTTLEHGTVPPPHYTTSIDAALTLIPSGWLWAVDAYSTFATASVTLHGEGFLSARGDTEIEARAKTPALALCIASLRARS